MDALRLYQRLADNLSGMIDEGRLDCLRREDSTYIADLLVEIAAAESSDAVDAATHTIETRRDAEIDARDETG